MEDRKKASPYKRHIIKIGRGPGTEPGPSAEYLDGFAYPSMNQRNLAHNKAYAKFVDKIRSNSASIGNAMAEWSSSYEMIAQRASQLRKAYSALRKGDIAKTISTLGISPKAQRNAERRVSKKHEASGQWLELQFGWRPLIQDIHDAIKVLESPFDYFGKPVKAAIVYPFGIESGGGYLKYNGSGTIIVVFQANAQITNPNLYMAQSMGLINPASVAWEITPFSFVVDWFTNVGQIVDSFTDFAGVTLRDGFTTEFIRGNGLVEASTDWSASVEVVSTTRSLMTTLPNPRLAYRSPITGATRAATQISLLTQLFIKPR